MSENQKTEEKPEDQNKGWITKLGGKWVQALIATLIDLSITVPLAFFWDEGVKTVKTWYAERQNMSYNDALAEAKENIGASTADVIPFRNADSNEQYIVVITNPPQTKKQPGPDPASSQEEQRDYVLSEKSQCAFTHPQPGHQCYPIKILQKTEDASPEVVDPGLAAYDSRADSDKYATGGLVGDLTPEPEYRNSLLGVVDIDGDGNKEVYSMYRSTPGMGTGNYLIKVKLYDSLTGDIYELQGSAEPQSTTVNPKFTGKRPSEAFAKWMNQQLDTLVLFNGGTTTQDKDWEKMSESERYDQEVRDWVRDNGAGFDEGQVKAQEHEGQPPNSSKSCSINDGNFEWHPYFKGALFVYDKSRDAHYVVWVPKSNYDMVATTNIVAGKQYLWLGLIKDDGLLVFNKGTQALEVIPVPELKGTPSPSPPIPNIYERAGLMLQGSTLYATVGNWSEQLKVVPLTLPDTITATDEFENAGRCPQRSP